MSIFKWVARKWWIASYRYGEWKYWRGDKWRG